MFQFDVKKEVKKQMICEEVLSSQSKKERLINQKSKCYLTYINWFINNKSYQPFKLLYRAKISVKKFFFFKVSNDNLLERLFQPKSS